MEEVKLPSGAMLRVGLAPFADARDLYQAVLEEARGVKINPEDNVLSLQKEIFCAFLTSKKVEAAVWKCMEKCLYNGARIKEETFEPELARGDYIDVLYSVTEKNVSPFLKSLSAEFSLIREILKSSRA